MTTSAPVAEPTAQQPTARTTESQPDDPRCAAAVQRFRLVVVSGADAGTQMVSRRERLVIGTHRGADLVLRDPRVSRFHCEISLVEGRPQLRDASSRNGTRIDGVSIETANLEAGAIIGIGNTQLRFELDAEPTMIAISERDHFGMMVGNSTPMRAVFSMLERAAECEATVLLTGETGTGKEAAAESLHRESPRRDKPFVVIDCGSIPRELLESELFGHERGAFTGAVAARDGAFQAASGGTLFLDEIGELPLDLQPKILRALERREIKRVGSNEYAPIDVRVVAATHRDLKADVNNQRFRSDLYYRLAVIEIRLPALRERRGDLALLVEHMLKQRDALELPAGRALLHSATAAELGRHSWSGNVRELRNHVERCLAMRELLTPKNSDLAPAQGDSLTQPFRAAREAFERRYLEALLHRHRDNVSEAARAAGLDRVSLYRLLWRHCLR